MNDWDDFDASEEETVFSLGDALSKEGQPLSDTLSEDLTLQHYEVGENIAQGAMGAIFNARHTSLKRQVAYKEILPELVDDTDSVSRFLKEMQITAQLEHPNIIPVYEFELAQDRKMAYSMKLVEGKTLKELIVERQRCFSQGKPLPLEVSDSQMLLYFLSVCDAMSYAHSKGVIHRDLKPANIMVGVHNEVYVMDWGIARQIAGFQVEKDREISGLKHLKEDIPIDQTRAGHIMGTPRYMSPEQASGKSQELTDKTDQFSLGLILFEILTACPAFQAENTAELLAKIIQVQLTDFNEGEGPSVHPELQAIVLKALAKKPAERYANLAEMAQDIRCHMHGEPITALADTPLKTLQRWVSKNRLKTLSLCLSLVFLCLLSVGGTLYNQQASLAKARAIELKLNTLFGRVSHQAQEIDGHFLKMQGILRTLAASTEQYLGQSPEHLPHYAQHPYTAPGQFHAPLFGANISLDWPTAGFSPGKSMADMQGNLEKILPLKDTFKELILRSSTPEPEKLSPERIRQLIGTEGTPIMWIHVSLKEGVIYMYPGIGFNTPGYDARTRPFYRLSAHKYGVFWGSPYFDPLSGALLPATTSIYNSEGAFMGVAGIDMRFQYVIDKLLTIPQAPEVKQTYLLNDKAEIMIQSAHQKSKKTESLTEGFETPVYASTALLEAIQKKERGGYLLDSEGPNGPRLLVYARVNTLGWYYLAELEHTPETL